MQPSAAASAPLSGRTASMLAIALVAFSDEGPAHRLGRLRHRMWLEVQRRRRCPAGPVLRSDVVPSRVVRSQMGRCRRLRHLRGRLHRRAVLMRHRMLRLQLRMLRLLRLRLLRLRLRLWRPRRGSPAT